MSGIIGIRREDKNIWERRVPLIPDDILNLKKKYNIRTIIQPSNIRIFSDEEYQYSDAKVSEDLSSASTIFAVKEIPVEFLLENKTYVFFSHTIKGQSHNMMMLNKLMDLKCNLIDFERIVDEQDMRMIFFGRYAGLAGMLRTLRAYGKKIKAQGQSTPFEKIKRLSEYVSVEDAKEHVREIGNEINERGLPVEICPLIVGFTGYGNVSKGAQEIFDLLPYYEIHPAELADKYDQIQSDCFNLYKVEFKEKHMVNPKDGQFELQDYYDHPGKYVPNFHTYLPYLTILMNCIFWSEDYPRLVTKNYLKNRQDTTLSVIGDISCDINGAVEITYKTTNPDDDTFTYFPLQDQFKDGIYSEGITVMAVDNLPADFSREASIEFSSVLKEFVNEIVMVDFNVDFENLGLSYPIKKALILHRGVLTVEYRYMEQFLKQETL